MFLIDNKINRINLIIILILVFVIMINFIFIPKSYSEAITLSAGLIVFLKACYAAGLTYIGLDSVNKLTDESIALWQEYNRWLDGQPPEQKPPNNWEKTAILTILGLQLSDSFTNLVASVKDFFNSLGSKEGENNYILNHPDTFYLESMNLVNMPDKKIVIFEGAIIYTVYSEIGKTDIKMVYDGVRYRPKIFINDIEQQHSGSTAGFFLNNVVDFTNIKISPKQFQYSCRNITESWNGSGSIYVSTLNLGDVQIPPQQKIINYYFENNTFQFTNNSDDIKPVYPNISNLPLDRITTETTPDGKIQTIFNGTEDELYNDIIKNTPQDNIFTDKPVKIEKISDDKIVIKVDGDNLPYPEIVEEDVAIVTGLGKIIALLKQSINWFSKIFTNISEIPEKIIDGIKNLFIIPDGYFGGKNNDIKLAFTSKFNPDKYFILFNNLKSFTPKPLPDLYLRGSKIIDSSWANAQAPKIQSWLSGILWIMLGLYNLNNILFLIRGVGIVDVKARNDSIKKG